MIHKFSSHFPNVSDPLEMCPSFHFFGSLFANNFYCIKLVLCCLSYYLGSQKPTGTVVSLDYSEDGTPALDTSFSI